VKTETNNNKKEIVLKKIVIIIKKDSKFTIKAKSFGEIIQFSKTLRKI